MPRVWTEEQKKVQAEKMRNLHADPERRAKLSAKLRGKKKGTVGRPTKEMVRKRLIARGRVEMSQSGRLRLEFDSANEAALWVVSHNFAEDVDKAERYIVRECKKPTGEMIMGFYWRYV